MAENGNQVNEIFDDLCHAADTDGDVTIGQITESLGHRGFGPFLVVPALIEISPLGGIPGVPTLLALIIAIFAVQIAFGRNHMWLPDLLERRKISGQRIRTATAKMRPVARWLDRWFRERLPGFAGPRAIRVAAIIVLVLCLSVPPLELLPFASTGPMAAIALIGLAMTIRDGALMLGAYAFAALGLVAALLSWLGG